MGIDYTQTHTLQLGLAGEKLVTEILHNSGWSIYKPAFENESYPVDRIMMKKNEVYFLEVKTKPRRTAYPDTGMDKNDFYNYLSLYEKTHINVLVIFVDTKTKTIYGASIDELDKDKNVDGNIVYFPLNKMNTLKGDYIVNI